MILWSPIKCLFETILPSPISPWPKSSEYRIIWRGQIFCWPQRSIFFCRHWSPLALEFSEQPQDGRPHLPSPGNPTVHQRDSRYEAIHHAGENLMFVTTWIFLHLKTGIVFLSDPGKPGVRSLGPDVSNKHTFVKLNWCDWCGYQVNTNW